jgi:F-type H+-transporting ATPase subunit gamma
MSRRAALERHLGALKDIRDIMNAMKNLSLMETRKLAHVLSTQRAMMETLDDAATDFAEWFPEVIPDGPNHRDIHLLIGSERGVCGDFNETVIAAYEAAQSERSAMKPFMIAVGSRLGSKLPDGRQDGVFLAGPSTAEEIPPVMLRLMKAIDTALEAPGEGPLRLTVVAHDAESAAVQASLLRPFSGKNGGRPRFSRPPMLNVHPKIMAADLAEQYLFARLSGLFDNSLLAENQSRLQHMENAIRHLDQETAEYLVRRNRLRQEEIIEEIEVLLLSDRKKQNA